MKVNDRTGDSYDASTDGQRFLIVTSTSKAGVANPATVSLLSCGSVCDPLKGAISNANKSRTVSAIAI